MQSECILLLAPWISTLSVIPAKAGIQYQDLEPSGFRLSPE